MRRALFVLSVIGILAGLFVLRAREDRLAPDPSPMEPVAEGDAPIQATPAAPPSAAAASKALPAPPGLPTSGVPADFAQRMAEQCDPGIDPDSERMRRNVALIHGMRDRTPEGQQQQLQDIRWMLRNAPESQCLSGFGRLAPHTPGRDEALALLESLAGPEDAPIGVIANYAAWMVLIDPAETLELYGRLQARDPENPEWLQLEANLHMRDTKRAPLGDPDAAASATLAMEALTEALQHAEPGPQRSGLLAKAVSAAAIAGNYEAAEDWGRELLAGLDPDRPESHARWTGHEGLGLAALGRGDAEGAIAELLQMSDVPPGPVQRSFGPSMRLADQLLKAGHRDAVVQYLEKVGTFWKPDRVSDWVERIRAGETFTLNRFG